MKNLRAPACADSTQATVAEAAFPVPFAQGLEYGTPARGTWNIVHTGMLIPQAHQIFVCAAGCLRGVVLTAAEMGLEERFSTVEIRENNLLDGDMEELIIEGVSDILHRLPQMPPAVLIYTSCIHHFLACDLDRVYDILRKRFPDVGFAQCYMNPIMRKSGLTPDQLMRRGLYSLLEPCPLNEKSVSTLGNDLPTDESSELYRILSEEGFTIRDITRCRDYAEYQQMAQSALALTYNPAAIPAGEFVQQHLGAKHLYLPLSYDFDVIAAGYDALCDTLGIARRDFSKQRERADAALRHARQLIGDTPVEIDYTLTFKPLGLARLLLSYGFRVTTMYADAFLGEEREDFEALRRMAPGLVLRPTVHAGMRFASRERGQKVLALGQKAAYFAGTPHFVNVVECGGMFGFDGICRLAKLMEEAFCEEKDTKSLIQIKGLGCGCCS